jgi:hypothetical protein
MSALAGIALLGLAALGAKKRRVVTAEEVQERRAELMRKIREDRKARREEDRIRAEALKARPWTAHEGRGKEITRIRREEGVTFEPQFDPKTGRPRHTRQARGSKAEVRTALEIANRATVQKFIAELRKAINKKRMGYAHTMYRKLEDTVGKLDPERDGPMIDSAERVLKVARSRGIK